MDFRVAEVSPPLRRRTPPCPYSGRLFAESLPEVIVKYLAFPPKGKRGQGYKTPAILLGQLTSRFASVTANLRYAPASIRRYTTSLSWSRRSGSFGLPA